MGSESPAQPESTQPHVRKMVTADWKKPADATEEVVGDHANDSSCANDRRANDTSANEEVLQMLQDNLWEAAARQDVHLENHPFYTRLFQEAANGASSNSAQDNGANDTGANNDIAPTTAVPTRR